MINNIFSIEESFYKKNVTATGSINQSLFLLTLAQNKKLQQ